MNFRTSFSQPAASCASYGQSCETQVGDVHPYMEIRAPNLTLPQGDFSDGHEYSSGDPNLAKVRPHSLLAQMALPCQSPSWDYGECYSYYANGCYNTCQFVQFGDIEDFMNNEKRKEKSRDAARSRRSKETEISNDLAGALPVPAETLANLDKASVMRLAISYLRVKDMVKLVSKPQDEPEDNKLIQSDSCESMYLNPLEGFVMVISSEGDVVYVTENVNEYLGLTQIDLMGQHLNEFCHPCDHGELGEILSAKNHDDVQNPKNFFLRLKCTLTSKGRSVNLKSASYKVVHCTGHMIGAEADTGKEEDGKRGLTKCLMVIGKVIPHPSNIETPLPRNTFLTKHSMDMKFVHADDQIMSEVLGYDSDDLVGNSAFDYFHALDGDSLRASFKCLHNKGQVSTNRYRFLAKTGGYAWVLTDATLISEGKGHQNSSVMCVNYFISGVECKDEIYTISQLAALNKEKLCISNNNNCNSNVNLNVNNNNNSSTKNNNINNNCSETTSIKCDSPPSVAEKVVIETKLPPQQQQTPKIEPEKFLTPYLDTAALPPVPVVRPLTSTSKIFAPRTEEMNKGFLTFSDDEPGLTMLKDEPDDLTHLAPVAGDVCVPLDDTNSFLNDMMLDDFLLRDSFALSGPLLEEDPIFTYRNSYDSSPQLLSPNMSKNSECSLPSLNSPSDSLSDEDRMSTFMSLQMDDDQDLSGRTPYISIDASEELPLMITNDLMWNSNERSKNGPDATSNLAQLLSSRNKHSLKSNDHGGGLMQDEQMLNGFYNNLTPPKSPQLSQARTERTNSKRSNDTICESPSKRSKNEPPKEKMSSELLQQLMSNNHNRGRPKGKSNWLLDSGGQKAACISQPSDSVLMNLLDDPMMGTAPKRPEASKHPSALEEQQALRSRKNTIRKNSLSLLEPEATAIPSLLDLTQQDFEVNAPVSSLLLHGADLLSALDLNGPI